MAGVAPRSSGSNATTIGMVISIAVSVALLGVLIWLITGQEQLRADREQAVKLKSQLASVGDESKAKQMFPEAGGTGKTLVGEMNKGIAALAGGLTGNQSETPSNAVGSLKAQLDEIANEGKVTNADQMSLSLGAVGAVKTLYAELLKEQETRKKKEEELSRTKDALASAQSKNDELLKKFDAAQKKLEEQVAGIQKSKQDHEELRAEEANALTSKINDKQAELQSAVRNRREIVQQFKGELADQERVLGEQSTALRELRGQGLAHAAEPLAVAREPVGKVLKALPGDSLVHVDLGRDDHATLGMTFAVYSAGERIPEDGRGKATVEIVSLGQRTAECRVVAAPSPDEPILEGDKVNNIILSRIRGKKQTFCVVGQFDIDFDGQVDVRGPDAIKALIERSGGKVVDRVDALTDYVVAGLEPAEEAYAEKAAAKAADKEEEGADAEAAEETDTAEESGEKDGEDAEAEEGGDEEDGEEGGDDSDNDNADDGEEEGGDSENDNAEEGGDEGDNDNADDGEEEGGDNENDNAEEGGDDEDNENADEGEEGEDGEEDGDDDSSEEDGEDAGSLHNGELDGAAPPAIEKPVEQDPTAPAKTRRELSAREKYDAALRRAQMFGIPVLTQDRFFNFIGIEGTASSAKRLLK